MRRFGPILAATAIGATALFAVPALAETSSSTAAQQQAVAVNDHDHWKPFNILEWALTHEDRYYWDLRDERAHDRDDY
ncbi:hypothetical protein [Nonomuraea sp. NPDC002799]